MRRGRKVFVFLPALIALLSLNVCAQQGDIPIGDSPQVGPSDAAVTIVEFTDYR